MNELLQETWETLKQNPRLCVFKILRKLGVLNGIEDEKYLEYEFKAVMGYPLNIKNPQTFNEKIQWLKLYDRKPEYTTMVDKYTVKEYVANKIGKQYIIPTYGIWDNFDEIDFDSLPNKFVLKCTHDSCGVVICRDKAVLDKKAVRKKIMKSQKKNYYYSGREWPYKNVKPRIIAEKYMEAADKVGGDVELIGNEEIEEYKLFCFNGVCQVVLVCKGQAHGAERTNDYCDKDLNRLPFTSVYPNSERELRKPRELPEMVEIAEKLSENAAQVRVDLYLVDGKIYFGELTLYHNSGFGKFEPEEWDKKLGKMIQLPASPSKRKSK